MNRYKEMLKQAVRGKASCNAIAINRGFSHHTVRRWRDVAISLKLTEEAIDAMKDSELAKLFRSGRQVLSKAEPNSEYVETQLAQGYNLSECHQSYVESVGEAEAFAYSTFCQFIRQSQSTKAAVFRHNHIAGLTMQTDFAGYRPQGIEENCERKFELFLATLPASHYCFAFCVRSQSTLDHIEAYIAALEFFGGAPEILVTDNLKAAVIARPRRAAPVINPVMMCAADYYNMRVEPTRVRRPKDKAAVEVAVKLVQRLLRLRLRRQPLLPLSDINRILAEIIEQLNQKKMRRGNESRRDRFERLDRPALQPLPTERLQFVELPVNRRVQTDHHIPFSKSYYSVPYSLVGKLISVRSSSALVEIRFDGHVVAIHRRSYQEGDYVTLDIHRPENHMDQPRLRQLAKRARRKH
jgi:transposase